MVRYFLVPAILICGMASSPDRAPLSSPSTDLESKPPPLNAKRAREALMALTESPDAGNLKGISLKELTPEEETRMGPCQVGPFSLYLAEGRYRYDMTSEGPIWRCHGTFEGRFKFQDKQWVAVPPRATMYACGKR